MLVTVNDANLKAIADAIREKNGTEETYKPSEMAAAIRGSQTSGGENNNDTEMLSAVLGRKGTELNCDAQRFGENACYGWTELTKARLPSGRLFLKYSFRGCTALTTIDIGGNDDVYPSSTSDDFYFANNAFNGASALETLILRPNVVAKMQGTTVFTTCPITSGTGYIYVPAALVDSYKAAANWSTYANQIRAIEDYPEITGGGGE